MICIFCGTGTVTWCGPLSALTHTQCSECGRRNCQQIADDADEEGPDTEDVSVPPMTGGGDA